MANLLLYYTQGLRTGGSCFSSAQGHREKNNNNNYLTSGHHNNNVIIISLLAVSIIIIIIMIISIIIIPNLIYFFENILKHCLLPFSSENGIKVLELLLGFNTVFGAIA